MIEALAAAMEQMLAQVSNDEAESNKRLRTKAKSLISALSKVKATREPELMTRGCDESSNSAKNQ